MFGWIMPLPLAIAPMRTALPPTANSSAISFGWVSVVMIAVAASWLPASSAASLAAASGMPLANGSMLMADDAGGGRQHVVRADAQLLGDDVAGVLSQLHAVGRAGVGVAAVHNDGLCIAVLQVLAVHRDGCAVDLVGGIAARARAADVRLDQRQIELGMVMADAAMYARRGEALRRTDAAGN